MFEIDNVLVSLDIAERYFCCDVDKCHGQCCIEGDAEGAPLTVEEDELINRMLPAIEPELALGAVERIRQAGTSYRDGDNDLVTQLAGDNCVFVCMAPGGLCQCAIERACQQGKTGGFRKPMSCALYPIRETPYQGFTALNYHRWKICKPAEVNGRRLGIRVYQFLERPLTDRFGPEWYAKLREACEAWNEQRGQNTI